MMRTGACSCLLAFVGVACYVTQTLAQNDSCEEDVDFPITLIDFGKKCSSASDCGPGEQCENSPSYDNVEIESPVCADFTADLLEDCDIPNGAFMPSPGCKRNDGIECDVEDISFSVQGERSVLAVCRREIEAPCTSTNDCIGAWATAPDNICVNGKCQQFGYVEDCGGDGERCSGGQVCTSKDSSQWIDGSTPTYACFNRADRGEPCKNNYPNNGYMCKQEDEVDYKLLCVGSEETPKQDYTLGVCKSYTFEIGAECNENIMCGQSECIDGKCIKVDEPPGTECSTNTDCDSDPVAPESECVNGNCVFIGFRGFCFSNGETCPGGQTCWGIPNGGRPVCVDRAAKGEPCQSFRFGPFNAYACKPRSETGFDMACIFGDDAQAIPGPGPGGAGGGVDGLCKCMELVDTGAEFGEDKLLYCRQGDCVNGTCQSNF